MGNFMFMKPFSKTIQLYSGRSKSLDLLLDLLTHNTCGNTGLVDI